MLVLFVVLSIFDLIGLSMIGPLLNLVIFPESSQPAFVQKFLGPDQLFDTSEDLVKAIGLALICVFTVKSATSMLMARKIIIFSQRQQAALRKRLIVKYQSLDLSQLLSKDSNHYINVIQNHCGNFAALTNLLLQNIGDFIVSVVIIGFLIWTNPYAFFLITALLGVVVLVFDRLTRARLRKSGQAANVASKKIIQNLRETIGGFKEIRILGCEAYFHDKLFKRVDAFKDSQITIMFFSILPRYIIETLVIAFIALLAMSIAYFETLRESLVATLGMFGVASLRLLPFARNLSTVLNKLHFFTDTVDQLFADLQLQPSKLDKSLLPDRAISSTYLQFDKLEIRNVCFAHEGSDEPILNSVTIEIKKGETIGIVGASGAGKTTLVDVILGFLTPQSGGVFLNGESVVSDSRRLWEAVAYLPQELFLVDSTIKENVALGQRDAEIDDEQLSRALKRAELEELVSELSDGVNTMIGESGLRISGGQRQRIALARAFYFGKDLLVLDEATSALDTKIEAQIVDQIQRIRHDIAVIYVSHRMSTLKYCDRIFAIEGGTVTQIR